MRICICANYFFRVELRVVCAFHAFAPTRSFLRIYLSRVRSDAMPDQTCPADKSITWCEKRGLSHAFEYRGPPAESALIFAAIGAFLLLVISLQRKSQTAVGRWLPEKGTEKREYEVWVLRYSVFWMGIFGMVVVTGVYEAFDASAYFVLCGGLAAPLLLQPLLFRGPLGRLAPSPGAQHAARAQLWIIIFGFIGNWWYTHYFYCVLRAKYTMPSWRFNDVPIAMFAATHFYFSSYHVFANLPIRYVRSAYEPGSMRVALEVTLVLAMSYFTAFMEVRAPPRTPSVFCLPSRSPHAPPKLLLVPLSPLPCVLPWRLAHIASLSSFRSLNCHFSPHVRLSPSPTFRTTTSKIATWPTRSARPSMPSTLLSRSPPISCSMSPARLWARGTAPQPRCAMPPCPLSRRAWRC